MKHALVSAAVLVLALAPAVAGAAEGPQWAVLSGDSRNCVDMGQFSALAGQTITDPQDMVNAVRQLGETATMAFRPLAVLRHPAVPDDQFVEITQRNSQTGKVVGVIYMFAYMADCRAVAAWAIAHGEASPSGDQK